MKGESFLEKKIAELSPLVEKIQKTCSIDDKLAIVQEVLHKKEVPSALKTFLVGLSPACTYVLLALIAIEQERILLQYVNKKSDFPVFLRTFLQELLLIENFYRDIGGIVGYHYTVLRLLVEKDEKKKEYYTYHQPPFCDIAEENAFVRKQIIHGIEHLPHLCEIYVVGGAADRLHLCDQKTKQRLPAAMLQFAGKTFLETLIQDVQAKEYLYYKLLNKQTITPICLMTSYENDNHHKILELLAQNLWFGRNQEDFQFFIQPLVPIITEEGNWCVHGTYDVIMKPGGHGVLWKLAKEKGVLHWLKARKRKKALVRQINNPMAGTDYGLLAFLGIGLKNDMRFGFASCPRAYNAAEGINVVIEKASNEFVLTNIEYCDFSKYGIQDVVQSPKNEYSQFPSNTNILFADLDAIEAAIDSNPFPGMLVNAKPISYVDSNGIVVEKKVSRLETIMQNIADSFVEKEAIRTTYITYNERKKTISTIKKVFHPEKPPHETPENCFYDLLHNHEDLLRNHVHMQCPSIPSFTQFLKKGPPWFLQYHPALGPNYSIIAQKIQGGRLALGAELRLNIAEIEIKDLDLQGSLIINAKNVLGHRDDQGTIVYSDLGGKCILNNVQVYNQGAFLQHQDFWKGEFRYQESCVITIEGNGEFYASNVSLLHDLSFHVPDGYKMEVFCDPQGKMQTKMHEIKEPSWYWQYQVGNDEKIILQKTSERGL